MTALGRIPVDLTILIGAVDVPLGEIARFGRGAVIPLKRDANTPLTILANGTPIGQGRVRLRSETVAVEVALDGASD